GYDATEVAPSFSLIVTPLVALTTHATYMGALESGTIVGDTYKNFGEGFDPYGSKQYANGAKNSVSETLLLRSA
ncbi:hypothetical protein ACOTVX_11405, partial [Aliarcobacter butzleri]